MHHLHSHCTTCTATALHHLHSHCTTCSVQAHTLTTLSCSEFISGSGYIACELSERVLSGKDRAAMFLNVSVSGGAMDAAAPKTPEILNSLISLTSPPLPVHYSHYQVCTHYLYCQVCTHYLYCQVCTHYPHCQRSTSELLSPDCSTPGDDIGGVGSGWGVPEEGGHPLEAGASDTTLGYTTLRNATALGPQFPTSSLLTPTSDGSSPPPTSSHQGLPHAAMDFSSSHGVARAPVDLPSPVNTVEATRSALIKEGLKLQITSKLQQTGTDPEALLKPDPAVVKTELTREDEERRRRRRERNKLAATKCRNKKKEMTEILMSESESVADLNVRLKGEVERLKTEKERLEKSLTDSRHRLNCKHHRQYDPSQIPSLSVALPPVSSCTTSPTYPAFSSITSPSYASPSSSSCCSASSPNSFSSLLSPSADSKDFINSLPSPSSLPLTDCGLGAMYVASTASSLDYIEPTIPSDTATTSKVSSSSRLKGPHRYHPYLYPTSPSSLDAPMRQESILGDYPNASRTVITISSPNSSVASENTIQTCGASVAQTYPENSTMSYAYTDTTTNPFCYPVVTTATCSNFEQQQSTGKQYIQLETACVSASRSDFRKTRALHGVSTCSGSRYTPYSINSMRHGANDVNIQTSFNPTLSEADQPCVLTAVEPSLPHGSTPSDHTADVSVAITTMACGVISNTVACASQINSFDCSQTCASNAAQQNFFFPTTSYGTCDSQ
ncbi:Basic-leucine zipper domain [Trinorchestia longiramus]|nr:Basic-leucine zipper domain [Trinorchestia longiramus]